MLYAVAFVAIVQIGPADAQRSITHLTLIAGFASTLFWPLTSWLHGSGLTSIIGGTLPLEVFGRDGYGRNVGWMSAARQFTSAFAPFAFALMTAGMPVTRALAILAAVALAGVGAFGALSALAKARP